MSQKEAPKMELGELVVLEGSVLRTLCLTINAEVSELKSSILDSLSENDFYFPVTQAVFGTIVDLHRQGQNVNAHDLQETLRRLAVNVPDDFYIEDLFVGDLPTIDDLKGQIGRLKNGTDGKPMLKSKVGSTHPSVSDSSKKTPPAAEDEAPPQTAQSLTVAEDPDLGISAYRQTPDSTPKDPWQTPPQPDREPPASLRRSDGAILKKGKTHSKAITQVTSVAETRKRAMRATGAANQAKPETSRAKPRPPERSSSEASVSPESTDWLDYLDELSSMQGKRLASGFAGLDDALGGLRCGLMLLADEDQSRARDFLKQLTDQIALHSKVPCFYFSFGLSKDRLRLRTLSRLAGVPSEDIESGRFEKDSPEWKKVLSSGREAMEWLERVFVIEAGNDLGVGEVRDLSQQVLGSDEDAMSLVALDSFERLGGQKESIETLAELKELAESRTLLVVAAAEDLTLLSLANADLAARLSGDSEVVELELSQSIVPKSLILSFQYQPEIHSFHEKNG